MKEIYSNEKKFIQNNRLKFTQMAKQIGVYLKEEGLTLSFLGYTETLTEYIRMTDNDFEEIGRLAMDLNLWSDYMGELSGLIQIKMLASENKLLYLQAFCDKRVPDETLDNQIAEEKKKHSHFKLFLKHLDTQKKMFSKAHRHCLRVYSEALNSLLYKYND